MKKSVRSGATSGEWEQSRSRRLIVWAKTKEDCVPKLLIRTAILSLGEEQADYWNKQLKLLSALSAWAWVHSIPDRAAIWKHSKGFLQLYLQLWLHAGWKNENSAVRIREGRELPVSDQCNLCNACNTSEEIMKENAIIIIWLGKREFRQPEFNNARLCWTNPISLFQMIVFLEGIRKFKVLIFVSQWPIRNN